MMLCKDSVIPPSFAYVLYQHSPHHLCPWCPFYTPAMLAGDMPDASAGDGLKNILTGFADRTGYFIAGGLAGMISRTATAPLDRLKVYLIAQTENRAAAVEAAKRGSAITAVKHFHSSLADALKDLWRAGGMRSLFAGNGLNVVKVMPESAIKFGAYEAAKKAFAELEGSDPTHLHAASQFLAGGIGGVVSQCVVYPLDTLKL